MWTLIILLGGLMGDVKSVEVREVSKDQCVAIVREMHPLRSNGVSAGCFGPDGSSYTSADVE